MSRVQISRAVRLVDSLLEAAEARGMTLRLVARSDHQYGVQRQPQAEICHLGYPVTFRIIEETDRSPHTPTPTELAAQKRSPWTRIPEGDCTPSGRLRIELPPGQQRDGVSPRSRFADGPARRVEDKIGELLDEVLVRGEHALQRQQAAQQLDQAYAEARAKAVDTARARHLDHLRAEEALAQATRWQQAVLLHSYVAAMRTRPGDPESNGWLEWIDRYAESLCPSTAAPTPPSPADTLTESELRPYLSGWPIDRPWGWQSTQEPHRLG